MHHLQRAVGVGRVRTLIWCLECFGESVKSGSASENRLRGRLRDVCKPRESRLSCQLTRLEQVFRLGRKMEKKERASVQGRRVRRSPRVNFSVSAVCTMKARSWLNVDIQNGGRDLSDNTSEAKMLHKEDKRAFSLRDREFLNLSFFRFLSCLVC